MSVYEYDVVIIGAGVAGLSAGISLAQKGFKVAVITRGEPTVCLSTGAIDVCSEHRNPWTAIAGLPQEHPFHLVPETTLKESLNHFLQIMQEMNLPYLGHVTENRLILSALGTFKTSCLVPVTMEHSPQDDRESIHIITFKGLKDFYPGYIVSRRKNVKFSVYDAGFSSTMSIASNFEERFFWKVSPMAGKQNIYQDKIAFPAVLGLESAPEIVHTFSSITGKPVFEIPTLPPSMPGRRLFNVLKIISGKRRGNILVLAGHGNRRNRFNPRGCDDHNRRKIPKYQWKNFHSGEWFLCRGRFDGNT